QTGEWFPRSCALVPRYRQSWRRFARHAHPAADGNHESFAHSGASGNSSFSDKVRTRRLTIDGVQLRSPLQHRGPDRWPFLKRLFRVPLVELRRFFPFVVSFQVAIFVANLAAWRSSEFPEDWISRFCMTPLQLQRRRGALAWRLRKCCEASFRAKDASTEIDGTLLGCESLGIVGQVCRDPDTFIKVSPLQSFDGSP